MLKKNLKFILFLVFIAGLTAAVWYSPIIFKGYSTQISRDTLLLARNYSRNGFYGAEDDLNVTVASSLAAEKANYSVAGNKLSGICYGWLFRLFGLPKYENLIFYSIAIFAAVLLIFTITVYYLFDFKTAALFSLIYIFLPFNWQTLPYNFGIYEIPLFFLSLFFLFFVLGLRAKRRMNYLFLIFAGILLALSGIAKEAVLLFVPVLFFYLLWQRQWKAFLFVFIPFFIIFSIFWLPDMLGGRNAYRLFFNQEIFRGFLDFGFYSHLFPDPYTYHFNLQNYVEKQKTKVLSFDLETITRLKLKKTLANMGLKRPGFADRLKVGLSNSVRHLSRFLAIEDIGGPLIFFLSVLGFVYLRKKDKYLYHLFVLWIVFVVILMSFLILGARNHLMDFGWVVALAAALGLLSLADIVSRHFQLGGMAKFFILSFLSLMVLYNLVLSSHVVWGRIYDENKYLVASIYGREVNKLSIGDNEVIAVEIPGTEFAKLNYLTDKSMVVFVPETIEELIQTAKLQDAFDKFGIKYILGYSPELTQKILAQAKVKNIVSDNIDLTLPEVSKTKSWLMNLVR